MSIKWQRRLIISYEYSDTINVAILETLQLASLMAILVNISNFMLKQMERVQNIIAGFVLQNYTTEHHVASLG